MTNEEAQIIIGNIPVCGDECYSIAEYQEAKTMSISALSVPEREKGTQEIPIVVREKGEWIKIQSGDKDFPESIVCSKCKNENSHLDFNEHGEPIGKVFITSKFCPNCGADMRGKAE